MPGRWYQVLGRAYRGIISTQVPEHSIPISLQLSGKTQYLTPTSDLQQVHALDTTSTKELQPHARSLAELSRIN